MSGPRIAIVLLTAIATVVGFFIGHGIGFGTLVRAMWGAR